MVAISRGGSVLGVAPPPVMSGKLILPDGFFHDGTQLALTASRYYYAYIYLDRIETFSGVKFNDQGVGNNGKKVKIAAFTLNQTTGALSGVAKNFGEVTLDAVAGIETMASSWTPTYIGWHILGLTSDSNPSIYTMSRGVQRSDAGYINPVPYTKLGAFPADYFAQVTSIAFVKGDYVAGTYANFPEASPLAPTNTTVINSAGTFPMFGLYK